MKKINLSSIRLFVILTFLICFSFIFASIFFIVTNSDVNEYIPYGQTQLTFENNELEENNINGIVLAKEVLDALPVERITISKGKLLRQAVSIDKKSQKLFF